MNISIEQLEEAISNLQVMTAFLDRDFNFIRVNQAYATASNKQPQDFVGKNHFALYPDAENEAIFRRVLETREPFSVRAKPFAHPELGTSYWDWRLQPLFEGGKLLGLALILIDVTEHVQKSILLDRTGQQLTDSEAHFRSLFNSGSDAIFVLSQGDAEHPNRVLEVNDIACQRLGYSREEMIGKTPADFNLPGYPKNITSVMQSIAQHRQALFETIHVTKDERHIPTEVNLSLFELEGQTRIFSIARDISERKLLENQLQQQQRNILALLNATKESSILLDRNGIILALNDVAAQRLRLSAREITGKSAFDLIPPELVPSRRDRFLEAVNGRKQSTLEDERAGIRFATTFTPILDEEGEVVQVALYAFDITERRQSEAIEHLLNLINQKILEGAPIQEVLDLVCKQVTADFGLALAWIGKKMGDGSVDVQASGDTGLDYLASLRHIGVRWDDSALGRGPTGSAVRTGTPQTRRLDDVRFSPWKQAAVSHGLKAIMAVPLILRGSVYGALSLYSTQDNQFDSPSLLSRIKLLTSKICLALEIAMEHEQIKLLSTAVTSARNAVMITDVSGRIEWINPAFTQISGYSSAELIGRYPSILKSGKHDKDYYQQLWQTILAGNVWSADADERRKDGSFYTVQQTITPIMDDEGKITHFVAVHEDVTSKLETHARILHMASHDALTGLPNRKLFFDRLDTLLALSKRNENKLALLFIDLDGFKQVNDTHGHHIGDQLLQEAARRLLACVRDSDIVARLGGDEFVTVLYDVDGREGVSRVAGKIVTQMSTPFLLEDIQVGIGASLGIALSKGHDDNAEAMIQRADAAMYQAKRTGKNIYRFAETGDDDVQSNA